jgi:hypothetical protein
VSPRRIASSRRSGDGLLRSIDSDEPVQWGNVERGLRNIPGTARRNLTRASIRVKPDDFYESEDQPLRLIK